MKSAVLLVIVSSALTPQQTGPIRSVRLLDADRQIAESQELAKETAAPQRGAKGDQHRTYYFPAAKTDMPYRCTCRDVGWSVQVPLIVMLHGAGADENRYLDTNNRQMVRLAEQHGYVLVSPLGYSPLGTYGTPLRLPQSLDNRDRRQAESNGHAEAEHTLELSEKDVINVLEIVMNEYPSTGLRSSWQAFHGRRWNVVPGREVLKILACHGPNVRTVRRPGVLSLGPNSFHAGDDERGTRALPSVKAAA